MRLSSYCGTLALATLTAASAFAQQDAPRAITLDEAVRLAQRNAPSTVQARNALRVGRMNVANSLAQFLPNLGVNAGANNTNGGNFIQGKFTPYTGDPWNYNKGYGGSLTIFDGGQRWFNYRAAQATQEANGENELLQRFTVALNVKQQYFLVLAARETEAAAQRQLEQADQQLRVTSARLRVGSLIRTDSLRSAIAVGTAKLAIINAQNSLRSANASLTRLVASPTGVTAVASDTSDVPRLDTDSATIQKLADQGPLVRQSTAALTASRASRRAFVTPYLPTVSAFYQYSTRKSSPTFDWGGGPANPSTGYGFSLNWTLFNNLNRELSLTTATVGEDNAEASQRDARLAARESLALYLGAFRTAQQTIELQLLQIAAAEDDFRAQTQRYALGSSSLLDVLTSQSALDAARTALITARLQARTAKAQLEALVGRELQ
ncbi:MAG TPA: TolC family protein [Gemmatimonadaceae bacterium]|nr:TolC family protein [Gemmatimonadaceae bacterium]